MSNVRSLLHMKRSRTVVPPGVRPGGGEGHAIPDLTISPIVRSHCGHLGLRRWGGPAGAVVLAVAAVAALSSTAGAASTPPSPGGSASGSVASITGTSMEVQSASAGRDDGQHDPLNHVLPNARRDAERCCRRGMFDGHGHAGQVVQDHHHGPVGLDQPTLELRHVHVGSRGRIWPRWVSR